MEGRGFGFVTFTDPAHAQSFLEVGIKVQKTLLAISSYWASCFYIAQLQVQMRATALLACRVYEL
jgi:hypothetical protein